MATRRLFKNGLIFDGEQPDLIADRHIAVNGGLIESIADQAPDGPFDEIIDLKGRVLMPGLIDAHYHAYAAEIDLPLLDSLPMSYLSHRAAGLVEASLKRGFTTLRDVGGADHGLWRAIEEGVFQGPRLFYCGRAFSQTGGHGDLRAPHVEPCGCGVRSNIAEIVDGPDDLRKAVREALRQGAHHIKLFLSGGIASPTDPIDMLQFSWDEICAVVDEAVRRHAYVVAHAYTAETIDRAVRAGVRSIEHGNLIDAQTAELVASHNAFVVPTLVTYDAIGRYGKEVGASASMLDKLEDVKGKGLEAIELCRNAGVGLGFGTDLLGPLHKYQLDELRIRSELETPFQILQSATSVNADLLNMTGKLGVVKPGAYADFLVINGNPLEDLTLLYDDGKGPDMIIKDGQIVSGQC